MWRIWLESELIRADFTGAGLVPPKCAYNPLRANPTISSSRLLPFCRFQWTPLAKSRGSSSGRRWRREFTDWHHFNTFVRHIAAIVRVVVLWLCFRRTCQITAAATWRCCTGFCPVRLVSPLFLKTSGKKANTPLNVNLLSSVVHPFVSFSFLFAEKFRLTKSV